MASKRVMPTVRVCVMTVEGNGLFTILVDENLTVGAVKGRSLLATPIT